MVTQNQRVVARGQHHGGDLRLVAHLGQEERHHGDTKHAEPAAGLPSFSSSALSGTSIHTATAMKDAPSTQRIQVGSITRP
jgi:hypothetical protein